MEITTLKEKGIKKEANDFVDVGKKEIIENTAVIGIYDIKLKVGDGIRFGFGFGFGMLVWGIIFLIISFFGARILMSLMLGSATSIFM